MTDSRPGKGRPTFCYANATASEEAESVERMLIKRRVLHIALNPVERGILHLCRRLNVKVKSSLLISALAAIYRKASRWLSSSFSVRIIEEGKERAAANVRAAHIMGLADVSEWIEDRAYLFLLGLNNLHFRAASSSLPSSSLS